MGFERNAEPLGNLLRCLRPGFTRDSGQDCEPPPAREIERRMLAARLVVKPRMRHACPWPCCWLIVQLSIEIECGLHLPVTDHSIGLVALVHLNAMGVKLVLLERNRLPQCLTLPFGRG